MLPSPAHIAQEHKAREATKSQQKEQTAVQHVRTAYDVGTPCYALYCGPRQISTPMLHEPFLVVFTETFKTSEEVLYMDYNSIVYMYNHDQPLSVYR